MLWLDSLLDFVVAQELNAMRDFSDISWSQLVSSSCLPCMAAVMPVQSETDSPVQGGIQKVEVPLVVELECSCTWEVNSLSKNGSGV